MSFSPDFSSDIEDVLRQLGFDDGVALGSLHRAQDLQSWLLHREAVRLLRADPALAMQLETTLARWMSTGDVHARPLLRRWAEIIAARDWDAALAATDEAQQLRQASPFASLVSEDTRLAIIRFVRELKSAR